jgi:flagellar motility protein MotE (MotC chaperone)
LAFAIKISVLGLMILDLSPLDLQGVFPSASLAGGMARAATGQEAAAAPPAVPPSVPGADSRGSAGQESVNAPPQRALPAIGDRPDVPRTNATSPAGGRPDLARESLARKQEELARKDQELRILDSEISAKLEQMQMLENRLSAMIKEAESARDAKFRHLVDVLSNMKARQAAAVLETLERKVAVDVLAGMRGRQAGEILSFVRPEVAAHLAESLARMQLPFE